MALRHCAVSLACVGKNLKQDSPCDTLMPSGYPCSRSTPNVATCGRYGCQDLFIFFFLLFFFVSKSHKNHLSKLRVEQLTGCIRAEKLN